MRERAEENSSAATTRNSVNNKKVDVAKISFVATMPKKFAGVNSKAAAAKARKEDKADAEKAQREAAIEDAKWRDDDKKLAKKQVGGVIRAVHKAKDLLHSCHVARRGGTTPRRRRRRPRSAGRRGRS